MLLNKLIGEKVFESIVDVKSCTSEIKSSGYKEVKFRFEDIDKKKQEILFDLNLIDTPGIADTEDRSKQFLDKIAQTIKTTPLNLIIILVEYGKLDTGVHANLEVLRECLNGMSQSSSMLIINKVPTEKYLERKRNGEYKEECRVRNVVLDETFNEVSKALGIPLKYKFFLENEDSYGYEDFNNNVYNSIRGIILSISFHLNASKVRTWGEICEVYLQNITEMTSKQLHDQITVLKSEYENRLDKIEWDIADYKYPSLELANSLMNLPFKNSKLYSNVLDFPCKKTKEIYFEKRKNFPSESANIRNYNISGLSKLSFGHSLLHLIAAGLVPPFLPVGLFIAAISFGMAFKINAEDIEFFCEDAIRSLENLDLIRNDIMSEIQRVEERLQFQTSLLEEERNILEGKKRKIYGLERALTKN